jgi:PAS domain S-box-containing protein
MFTQEELHQYEIVLSTITDPISLVQQDYRYAAVNDAYEQYAGRPKSEIVGRSVAEMHGEEGFRGTIKPHLDRCFDGHKIRFQAWFDSPALGRRLMEVRYVPLTDAGGSVVGVAVHSRDITERKQTERALRASRQFFQSALNALSSNIAVLDEQGTIVAVNASWRRFGMQNGLLWTDGGIGRNYLAVVDAAVDDSVEGARAAARGLRQVIAGGRESYWQEYPCHSPDERRWYTMWVTRFESSDGLRIVTSHENVTQRKLAELALRDAKEAAEAARVDAEAARQEEEQRRLDAERRRQIAESLRSVLSVLNSTRSLQEVLDHIVVQASQLLGSDAAAIYRARGTTEAPLVKAAQGLELGRTPPQGIPAAADALRQAIRARRAVAVPDTRRVGQGSDSPRDALRPATGQSFPNRYRALLAVPIIVKDVPYGGLLLYYEEPHACSQEEVELAVVYADQVALAIENARLHEQVEENAVAAERTRLARELHDAVTQTLFSASVIAESIPRIWDTHPQEAQRGLEELQQLTRGALAEMRTLLLELRPSTLTEKPLGDLLRNLAEATTSRTRVPVELSVEGDDVLPTQVQVALYRIAQEALNNVVKHAGATEVVVRLHAADSDVTLFVQDNGTGFDPTVAPPAGHFGVNIMRERAQQIGAALDITSEPGSSTRVTVHWTREKGTIHGQA